MTTTSNLEIPLIGGPTKFAKEGFNAALQQIDAAALPISHKTSVMHFPIWYKSTEYPKGSIVRSNNVPSWGVLEAISTTGTSGTVEPTASNVGDIVTDNSVTWKLEKISGGFSVHNDLSDRDADNAHPLSAITGLEIALAALMSKTEYTEAGVIVYPTIVDNENGTITVSAGSYNLYADSSGTLPLTQYTQIGTKTLTLVDKSDNFLCAYLNNGSVDYQLADRSTINYSNIVIICSMFRDGNFIDMKPWSSYAKNLAGMLLKRLNRTNRFPYENGLSLGELTGRIVTLTSGTVWFSTREISLLSFTSADDEMWQMILTSGVWSSSQVTQYNNSQYNGSAGLADLANNKYNVTWVFRDVTDTAKRVFLVLGTNSYSLADAKTSPCPALPAIISTQTVLVGRIICQKSATTAASIETAFGANFSGQSASNASDISIIDTGSYFTGTDVETALQEVGAVKHSHSNKTQLDKIGEDTNGNLTYNNQTIVGGATAWEPTEPYILNQLVTNDNKLYKCTTAHTSGNTFVLSNWQELTLGYIGNWEPLRYYSQYEVTINGNSIIRCSTAHTSRATYDTTEATNWSIIASRGAVVALWEPNTPYSKDEAVVYNDVIYLANSTHTSGSTFAGDMQTGTEKWRTINTSATIGDWKQLTESGVAANTLVTIPINNTLTFITPPVEILIYNAGAQGSIVNEFTFVAGDGSSFTVDGVSAETSPYVAFDGTAHPVNTYNKQMVAVAGFTGAGQLSMDSNIDDTLYKSIESGVEL
jgi:hypothetical protein